MIPKRSLSTGTRTETENIRNRVSIKRVKEDEKLKEDVRTVQKSKEQ
jgi:hypothetical protein